MTFAPGLLAAVEAFGLGELQAVPTTVERAWSNEVHRVRTTTGEYAVKLFPPALSDARRAQLHAGLRFEATVLDLGEVPMPRPVQPLPRYVSVRDGWLVEVGTPSGVRVARCHAWIRGCPATKPLRPDLVRAAGHCLGVLHALDLDAGNTSQLDRVDLCRWDRAVRAADDRDVSWAGPLASLTPLVRRLATDLDVLRLQRRPMRISHRDFDPKNTVIDDAGQLVVTDWDYAGPVLTEVELVVAATSFARTHEDQDAFLGSYRAAGGTAAAADPLAMTVELADLDWLLRNVEACVESATPNNLEQHRTTQTLIAALPGDVARMRSAATGTPS